MLAIQFKLARNFNTKPQQSFVILCDNYIFVRPRMYFVFKAIQRLRVPGMSS